MKTKYVSDLAKLNELIEKGYMITSRKFCLATRVDKYNWADDEESCKCADYYRRCVSKDEIEVSEELRKLMPKSSDHRGLNGRYSYPIPRKKAECPQCQVAINVLGLENAEDVTCSNCESNLRYLAGELIVEDGFKWS